jgi:hypothetical protein
MDKKPRPTPSKVDQMIDYRIYLMHLLPYCESDYAARSKLKLHSLIPSSLRLVTPNR